MNASISYFHILELLSVLAKAHIKDKELINKILDRLCEKPQTYSFFLSQILDSFYDLGFCNDNLKVFFESVENLPIAKTPEILFKYLLLLCINLKENLQEFSKIFNNLISSNQFFKVTNTSNLDLFYNVLKKNFENDQNFAEKFSKFVKKNKYSFKEGNFQQMNLSKDSFQVGK